MQNLIVPDLWQQTAVHALREGQDVIVQAPTGAGKTYIFELYLPSLKGAAIYTVPTRALANDKLAEWRARGRDVGISTGDLAFNLQAKIVVATLETQKAKFLRREGPRLLVLDEYQMIGDPARGVNYELALALAPPATQLLLLSGSVGNPEAVAAWLRRIGRVVTLVQHTQRPVPLEEINLEKLPDRALRPARTPWPRWVANALAADLGPVLLFAPRRQSAEALAADLAASLPPAPPLALSPELQKIAGPRLLKLLSRRVAYHHSGLSYGQRAALIEPLAKSGQLRAVVATMGLATGINFSMRSVVVTDTRYLVGNFARQVQPDELLQMFGRAGRRGLDQIGCVLVSERSPRLQDARPRILKRPAQVDWPSLLAVMQGAVTRGTEPFAAALELNERLFSTAPVPLGIEHARATGLKPCGLEIDMERARFARRGIVEIQNSQSLWEPRPLAAQLVPLGKIFVQVRGRWRPALALPHTLEKRGVGQLCLLRQGAEKRYGRELVIGTRSLHGALRLAPWLRRIVRFGEADPLTLSEKILPHLPEFLAQYARRAVPAGGHLDEKTEGPEKRKSRETLSSTEGVGEIVEIVPRGDQLMVRLDFSKVEVPAWIDQFGLALAEAPERHSPPLECRECPEFARFCRAVEIEFSPAHAWRRLGLIAADGRPTQRGILFSAFHRGEGLAIAAALEAEDYPIEDLLYDLANLRAGPRFSGEDSPWGGRLGALCQKVYERADLPGYLEMGVPLDYGAGASEVLRAILEEEIPRMKFMTEILRLGDIERMIVEWRSLLRHLIWAPDHELARWRALRESARRVLEETESPHAFHFAGSGASLSGADTSVRR